jgi:hypothetical protein
MKIVKKRASITARDITNGSAHKCHECPGALAINRLLKKDWICAVYSTGVGYHKVEENTDSFSDPFPYRVKCYFYENEIPGKLRAFMQVFDNDLPAKPVRFTIEIPEEILRHP